MALGLRVVAVAQLPDNMWVCGRGGYGVFVRYTNGGAALFRCATAADARALFVKSTPRGSDAWNLVEIVYVEG